MSPEDYQDIQNQLRAAEQDETTRQLAEVVANVAETMMGISDALKSLGEVVFPTAQLVEDLTRTMTETVERVARLERTERGYIVPQPGKRRQ